MINITWNKVYIGMVLKFKNIKKLTTKPIWNFFNKLTDLIM